MWKGSKKMNVLSSSYSIKPEWFLSNTLKRGSTIASATGSSSFFSIRSNSNEEMYPFLFSSYSLNNFLSRNSSFVPFDFWINLKRKAFTTYFTFYCDTTAVLSDLYDHWWDTYFSNGSSCGKLRLRSS